CRDPIRTGAPPGGRIDTSSRTLISTAGASCATGAAAMSNVAGGTLSSSSAPSATPAARSGPRDLVAHTASVRSRIAAVLVSGEHSGDWSVDSLILLDLE